MEMIGSECGGGDRGNERNGDEWKKIAKPTVLGAQQRIVCGKQKNEKHGNET